MTADRLNVLLVDDELSFRKVLRTSLSVGGFTVEEASCVRYRPVYDDYGDYIGRRAVNVCD